MAIPDLTSASLEDLVSLRGRRAVITGGAKGLGEAIARRFAEAGADVLLADVDAAGAQATADRLAGEYGTKVIATELDVTDSAAITAAADLAVAELGDLDIWVNNAGIYPLTAVLEMPDEQWDDVIAVNLRGTFMGCREAARKMVAAGHGGVIVNLSSTAGFTGGGPGIPHYVASKHGVRGITRQMALELAPQGIRLLAVAPTGVLTPGVERAASGAAAAVDYDLDKTLNGPLGRVGVPDDVARIVLFCASDLAMFMTGSTLLADQGRMVL